MPYYSYGYGYDSANLVYLILLVPVLLLSLYAQAAVSGNFSRYSKVTNRRGLTGAQAAAGVLRAHGITDVGIARCSGKLTDHYDPRNNTIFLSDSVYDAATVAAVGVAAHEAGHAVQYAVGYAAGKGCIAAGKPVPLEHLLERAVDPRAVPAAGRQRVQRRFSCTVDSHRRPPRRFPERLRKIKT